jgi:CRISPR-associated RAMP protein (TIGR02581 family)
MHKRLLNEAILEVAIEPQGPILIKAGDKGADPTLPDMEFVRTNGQPYLPGSSLKGVIRSHCERLARTVGGEAMACDTLHDRHSCGARLQRERLRPEVVHTRSCFACRLFGNTALASRFSLSDAMPLDSAALQTEERNGVAIDRVFGSVAVGPFNYETVTAGMFRATLVVRNFGLAQLGLLALTFRDLQQGRARLGFGKSRGLGTVTFTVQPVLLRYPTCELTPEGLGLLGVGQVATTQAVPGIGMFPDTSGYDCAPNDLVPLPDGVTYTASAWGEPEVHLQEESHITAFWRACVGRWREEATRWPQRQSQGS